MPAFGYTMMCEQARPDQLVRHVQLAEDAGFDFSVTSDHYQPWLEAQGHSGYAWSILGAAAQATTRIPLMTYVTCPTIRYHPAVVAQKAATMQILSQGRFRLGLGAGENLNEHVVGERWPAVGVRHEMLEEALDIISGLFDGDTMSYRGNHFDVESARLWDLPDQRVPIGLAVSGRRSCRLAGERADLMVATEPKAQLGDLVDAAGGRGKPRVGQVAVAYDPDRDTAVARARAVPVVRPRLEGQRGPARPGLLRGGDAVRDPRPGGRAAVLWAGRAGARRQDPTVRRRRLHRDRARADRRGAPGGVHRLGRA